MSAVFVVELHGHHGTTVFPLQALHLGENLTVEPFGVCQEDGIFGPHLTAFGEQPVGDAATACLTMAERSYAQYDGQLLLTANLEKLAQTALTTPVEHGFRLLNMIPEHITGDNRYPAILHFPYLISPFGLRYARIMHLTHHGTDSLPIDYQAVLIPSHFRNLCSHSHAQPQQPTHHDSKLSH